MKRSLMLICCLWAFALHAQTFMTRSGEISFYSSTPLEDIRARNTQVFAAIDVNKSTLAFSGLMKGFIFEKALMQEHFNENYVESDKFPKATFNGSFEGVVDPDKDGSYKVIAKGTLLLHGVAKEISVPATIDVKNGSLTCKSSFKVRPADHAIRIPNLVKDKIANEITVNVIAVCNKLNR